MNILAAMNDPKLFRPWFKKPETWEAWRAFLAVLFNLPMDDEQTALARACTGLETLPEQPFTEAWLVVGRRGGKSLVLAMIAIYLALFKDWSANLVPGERGTVLVLAADRRQAQSIMRYARALCEEVPMSPTRPSCRDLNTSNQPARLIGWERLMPRDFCAHSGRGVGMDGICPFSEDFAFWTLLIVWGTHGPTW